MPGLEDHTLSFVYPRRGRAWALPLLSLSLFTLLPAPQAAATPVASNAAAYAACGRVFPDPHAYWPSPAAAPAQSPWAKGNANCRAVDFLPWQATLDGLAFLASPEMFGDFIEIYDLSDPDGPWADALDFASGEGLSAGLPTTTGEREKSPMYLIRVTDEEYAGIPIDEREHFVYTLSIHGIEKAGVEGGIRAIEDLATWAACEKHGDAAAANCAQEGAGPNNPHPILETLPNESITAGEALRRSSVWFVLSNPDGWRRGDKQSGGFFYQRYNGNGMDMNRDWPTKGWTFRPFTPWSEPENRTTGKALKAIKEKWTGGVDLHGQIIAEAFSYTLIGGAERPFGKDRRVLQFVKGAWADAEQKLSWNPLIKGNDEPEPCVYGTGSQSEDPDCDPTNRIYGVQWGTIWDTIDYTVTGALGDWIDSPLGLDADGIDNEMSLSHLGTCGVGTCYLIDFEQLHVDGNKSLIYGMIHYSLTPEDQTFRYDGRAAYLYTPRVVADPGSPPVEIPDLPVQAPEATGMQTHTRGESVYEFTVASRSEEVYNGGLYAEFTLSNVQGVSPGTMNEFAIDRQLGEGEEADPQRGEVVDGWQTMNSYFNQSDLYQQAGARIDVNGPPPGRYRLRVSGGVPMNWSAQIRYTTTPSWPDPGQLPFEATNMAFFEMLAEFVPDAANRLVRITADEVLAGTVNLADFDTVIAADDAFLPGFRSAEATRKRAQNPIADTLSVPPAAPERAATAAYLFDVEAGHHWLEARIRHPAAGNMDLYLQRLDENGRWSEDLATGKSRSRNGEALAYIHPPAGRYRLQVANTDAPSQAVSVNIRFVAPGEAVDPASTIVPIDRTPADNIDTRPSGKTETDRDRMAAKVRDFVSQGGNLVLTDNSLQALQWMGLVPGGAVNRQSVYAGHVLFQYADEAGTVVTYDDPLAANVNQPGAAEGENHRHQVTEPIPIGYAIEDLNGGSLLSQLQWSVEREDWEAAGGRIVGTVGSDVTLGELPVGDGVVRILGTLLPFPSDDYDHPYGLSNYALTWTGYELTQNLLSWTNPNGTGGQTARGLETASSRGGSNAPLLLALLVGMLLISRRRRNAA